MYPNDANVSVQANIDAMEYIKQKHVAHEHYVNSLHLEIVNRNRNNEPAWKHFKAKYGFELIDIYIILSCVTSLFSVPITKQILHNCINN